MITGRPPTPPIERFLALTRREGDCLVWIGKIKSGPYGDYGLFWDGKKEVRAHRWFYEFINGYCPPLLHHVCENKRCVGNWHMEEKTAEEHCSDHHKQEVCGRGHLMTPENVYIPPKRKWRQCMQCRLEENRKSYWRHREKRIQAVTSYRQKKAAERSGG